MIAMGILNPIRGDTLWYTAVRPGAPHGAGTPVSHRV